MNNVRFACTPTSLRRFWRQTCAYLRYILPEIALIAGSVLIMLAIIRRFFFTR